MKYNVAIHVIPLRYYGIEAASEGEASSIALDKVYEEAMHDILKWADVEVDEVCEHD